MKRLVSITFLLLTLGLGTPGTLWGDAGYDTLTSIPLWPWDDEAVIKTDMASFSMTNPVYGGTISGALFPSAIFNQIVNSTGTPSVTGTYTDEGGASFPISVATGVGAFH